MPCCSSTTVQRKVHLPIYWTTKPHLYFFYGDPLFLGYDKRVTSTSATACTASPHLDHINMNISLLWMLRVPSRAIPVVHWHLEGWTDPCEIAGVVAFMERILTTAGVVAFMERILTTRELPKLSLIVKH